MANLDKEALARKIYSSYRSRAAKRLSEELPAWRDLDAARRAMWRAVAEDVINHINAA